MTTRFDPIIYLSHTTENKQPLKQMYIEVTGDKTHDLNNLKKYKDFPVVLIGESHTDEYFRWLIEEAINVTSPDYFLTEHVQYTNVLPGEFETRLKNLKKDGLPYNGYTEYWLKVVMKYNIPYIGMDYLPPDGKFDTFIRVVEDEDMTVSFPIREKRMLEVIKEYHGKGKLLIQVGDTHLRTVDNKYLGPKSPVMQYALDNPDKVIVFRLPRKYQEVH